MQACDFINALYIDMNSYFASVEQQDDPALRNRPVGVLPGREMSRNSTCIAASYEAKSLGVRTGTKAGDALALCPGITFRAARHDRYVEMHQAIKIAVESVIPIEKTWSVDEFACVLTGPQRRLDDAIHLGKTIKRKIADDVGPHLRCSVGLAQNSLLAKIAGELEKPDGLQWILPGEQHEKLEHLALRDLPGINRGMEARLLAADIESVPALLDLAPRHARMIWGSVQGERFLRLLRGEDIPCLQTRRRMFGHSQVLSPDSRCSGQARIVARRLLTKAASRLRRADYLAARLSLGIKALSGGRIRRETSFAATQDTMLLLRALQGLWSDCTASRLLSVSVSLHGLVDKAAHTPDLFEDRPAPGEATRREALFGIVDQINQRYGRDTLTFGETPRQLKPFTGAKIAFNRVPDMLEFRE